MKCLEIARLQVRVDEPPSGNSCIYGHVCSCISNPLEIRACPTGLYPRPCTWHGKKCRCSPSLAIVTSLCIFPTVATLTNNTYFYQSTVLLHLLEKMSFVYMPCQKLASYFFLPINQWPPWVSPDYRCPACFSSCWFPRSRFSMSFLKSACHIFSSYKM